MPNQRYKKLDVNGMFDKAERINEQLQEAQQYFEDTFLTGITCRARRANDSKDFYRRLEDFYRAVELRIDPNAPNGLAMPDYETSRSLVQWIEGWIRYLWASTFNPGELKDAQERLLDTGQQIFEEKVGVNPYFVNEDYDTDINFNDMMSTIRNLGKVVQLRRDLGVAYADIKAERDHLRSGFEALASGVASIAKDESETIDSAASTVAGLRNQHDQVLPTMEKFIGNKLPANNDRQP